jgi:hypothetical protein
MPSWSRPDHTGLVLRPLLGLLHAVHERDSSPHQCPRRVEELVGRVGRTAYSAQSDGQGHGASPEDHSPRRVGEIDGRVAGVLDQAAHRFLEGHARQIGAEAVVETRSEREQSRRVGLLEAVEDEIVGPVLHRRVSIGRSSGKA